MKNRWCACIVFVFSIKCSLGTMTSKLGGVSENTVTPVRYSSSARFRIKKITVSMEIIFSININKILAHIKIKFKFIYHVETFRKKKLLNNFVYWFWENETFCVDHSNLFEFFWQSTWFLNISIIKNAWNKMLLSFFCRFCFILLYTFTKKKTIFIGVDVVVWNKVYKTWTSNWRHSIFANSARLSSRLNL